jgi:hypothetical protein
VAEVVGLELRNVVAKYLFERARGFPGIQPNSGHRDYSHLSCGVSAECQMLCAGVGESLRWQELPKSNLPVSNKLAARSASLLEKFSAGYCLGFNRDRRIIFGSLLQLRHAPAPRTP